MPRIVISRLPSNHNKNTTFQITFQVITILPFRFFPFPFFLVHYETAEHTMKLVRTSDVMRPALEQAQLFSLEALSPKAVTHTALVRTS